MFLASFFQNLLKKNLWGVGSTTPPLVKEGLRPHLRTIRKQSLRMLQTGAEEILLGYETSFLKYVGV